MAYIVFNLYSSEGEVGLNTRHIVAIEDHCNVNSCTVHTENKLWQIQGTVAQTLLKLQALEAQQDG